MAFDPVAEQKFASELVKRLPAKIRVGPFDFAIEKWSPSRSAERSSYGECSTIEQRISIQIDHVTRFKAVDTVLHEISHAIFWAYGIEDEDKEERIVGTSASAWAAVYRDNPWLIDWIKSAKL
jgi:hypothetical protein